MTDTDNLPPGDLPPGTLRRIALIKNRRGLHARASAKFVKLAANYDAEIDVRRGESTVCGQSIMGLMMLAAGPGTTIEIWAKGPEAETALAALFDLVDRKFDEED